MTIILLHHAVVHSGILSFVDNAPLSINSLLLAFIGIGGKIGVNIFFIITGYFVVKQNVRLSKILQIAVEIIFYNLLGLLIYSIPTDTFSMKMLLRSFFPLFTDRGGFIDTWVFVYIMAPFLNRAIHSCSRRDALIMLGILYFYFSILSLGKDNYMYSYFSWGITMYLTGAFLRLHPRRIPYSLLWTSLAIGILWLVSISLLESFMPRHGGTRMFYYLHPNMLPYILTSVPLFIIFRRIPNLHSVIINRLGGAAFGVYLLHDTAANCREALWRILFPIADFFMSPLLIFYIIIYCLAIYIVYAAIDMLRSRYLERPLFDTLNRHYHWMRLTY